MMHVVLIPWWPFFCVVVTPDPKISAEVISLSDYRDRQKVRAVERFVSGKGPDAA